MDADSPEVADVSRMEAAAEIAAEGIVLLDNSGGALPVPAGEKVALVGVAGYFCQRMGWGSGDMLHRRPVEFRDGMLRAGIELHPGFDAFYMRRIDKVRLEYSRINADWWNWTERVGEIEISVGEFERLAASCPECRRAIVVVGRCSGESVDRRDRPGSFRLHREEERLVRLSCSYFDKVCVLLNTCGVMDLSFKDRTRPGALVHVPLSGDATGLAAALVVSGRVNPSGRTVDTWASYREYPSRKHFGSFEVPYDESIFTGYRYFDDHPEKVLFPFGHGLSYTSFRVSFECACVKPEDGVVEIRAKVSNTGDAPGKDAVMAFLRPAERCAAEPARELCAFAKTAVIPPGGEETLDLVFDTREFARYDAIARKWIVDGRRWIVEAGDSASSLSRAMEFETSPEDASSWRSPGPAPSAAEDSPDAEYVRETVQALSNADLAAIVNGRPVGDKAWAGGAEDGIVPGEAGETFSPCGSLFKRIVFADGPSGVRLTPFGSDAPYGIAAKMFQWPSATALAQTWNVDAALRCGRALASDMLAAGVDVLLAPGVNIHRNPLCGRNFEYFSEDPFLAGEMAASVVRGIQTREDGSPSGAFAAIKHFCCNNQESHRRESDSRVDERALREIYLRPFEIAVKKSNPLAVMTSYNLVNGRWTASDPGLVDGILRGEWGFKGIVITDWWCFSDKRFHAHAGTDLTMPGVEAEIDDLEEALDNGTVSRCDVEKSAARILSAAMRIAKAQKKGPE